MNKISSPVYTSYFESCSMHRRRNCLINWDLSGARRSYSDSMRHTESMGKIGRRCAFFFSGCWCFSLSCLFISKLEDILVFPFILSLSLLIWITALVIILLSLIYLNSQVAAAVRNRSIEMVEALYNMNRVNQYYSNLFCSLVSQALLYELFF
jgi:hypothetical protein